MTHHNQTKELTTWFLNFEVHKDRILIYNNLMGLFAKLQ
jgi:hypothetical protein